jgi:amidase
MPAAVSGYPHITVPVERCMTCLLGFLLVPVYSESKLTSIAYAYEQASKERTAPSFKKSFSITIDSYKFSVI